MLGALSDMLAGGSLMGEAAQGSWIEHPHSVRDPPDNTSVVELTQRGRATERGKLSPTLTVLVAVEAVAVVNDDSMTSCSRRGRRSEVRLIQTEDEKE
jgi:hypothetical protein